MTPLGDWFWGHQANNWLLQCVTQSACMSQSVMNIFANYCLFQYFTFYQYFDTYIALQNQSKSLDISEVPLSEISFSLTHFPKWNTSSLGCLGTFQCHSLEISHKFFLHIFALHRKEVDCKRVGGLPLPLWTPDTGQAGC